MIVHVELQPAREAIARFIVPVWSFRGDGIGGHIAGYGGRDEIRIDWARGHVEEAKILVGPEVFFQGLRAETGVEGRAEVVVGIIGDEDRD